MVLKLILPPEDLARVERLRGRLATRPALVRQLVALGLEVAEKDPARLVRPELKGDTA